MSDTETCSGCGVSFSYLSFDRTDYCPDCRPTKDASAGMEGKGSGESEAVRALPRLWLSTTLRCQSGFRLARNRCVSAFHAAASRFL